MNLKDLVLHWNNLWRYDLWYRRKYNIRFNSPEHRETNPLDIAFEYFEFKLEEKEKKAWDKKRDDEEFMKKNNGAWIRQIENKELDDELFDAIDVTKME